MGSICKIVITGDDGEDWLVGHYLNEGKTIKFKVEKKLKKELLHNVGKTVDVNMDSILRMQYTGDSNMKVKMVEVLSLDEYEERQ